MCGKFVLFVEYKLDGIELTLHAFRKNNKKNTVVVNDGEVALVYLFGKVQYVDRVISVLPKLVLPDIQLPIVDGLQVLKELRAYKRS